MVHDDHNHHEDKPDTCTHTNNNKVLQIERNGGNVKLTSYHK